MITFESVGVLAVTCCDTGNDSVIGKQVDLITEGIQPTYGVMAIDMDVKNIVITFTWSD